MSKVLNALIHQKNTEFLLAKKHFFDRLNYHVFFSNNYPQIRKKLAFFIPPH